MTINVEDYLTEEEKKQIAIECFRNECMKRSSEDFERIITNSAYHVVWQQVDEFVDKVAVANLKDKVRQIINDLTAFNVFKKPDAWDSKSNGAYDVLLSCVRENKDLINERVKKAIDQISNKDMRPIVLEAVKNSMK